MGDSGRIVTSSEEGGILSLKATPVTRQLCSIVALIVIGCHSGDKDPPPAPVAASCNAATGLSAPLPTCSGTDPCTRLAAELGTTPLTTASVIPECRTTAGGRTIFDDGAPIGWTDFQGTPHYACQFRPTGASPASPRPLLVWMHGGGGGLASDLYNLTTIRAKAQSYDLSNDPARPGFFVLAVQGRNLHYPTTSPRDGHHHDFYYRDLTSPSGNPDMAHVDSLIDQLAASGDVDTNRIYMMGWSNGGFFSQMYAIARHTTATSGGHRIAAAAVYTAADPFNNTNSEQTPSCRLDPYPTSTVPIFLVSRSCDIVACNEAQADDLRAEGLAIDPGHVVQTWLADLGSRAQNPNASWRIVSGLGTTVSACSSASLCSAGAGLVNHARWPDGVADQSGIDHEPAMLDFLRNHPR